MDAEVTLDLRGTLDVRSPRLWRGSLGWGTFNKRECMKRNLVAHRELEKKAQGIFREDPRVLFAYVFGSLPKEEALARSDVDLAVYLNERLSADQRWEKRLDLIGRLQGYFRTAPFIDLVVLNDTPLFLNFNIIREGKLLVCRNQKKRIAFEAGVMGRFYDEQYYFTRHAEATLERIARRGIL